MTFSMVMRRNIITMLVSMCTLGTMPALASAPAWQQNVYYPAGTVVSYNGGNYSALVNQTDYNGAGWTPLTTSLWSYVGPDSGSSGSLNSSSSPMSPGSTSGGTCAAVWNASTVYTNGMTASVGSTNYLANWWTRGENPTTNNGGAGSGEPWTSKGSCSGTSSRPSGSCAAAWSASAVYTGGMVVSVGTINYVANWWTQGQNPTTNNGGTDSGEPWTSKGSCSASRSRGPGPVGGPSPGPVGGPSPAPVGGPSPAPVGGPGSGSGSGNVPVSPPGPFVFSAYKDTAVNMNWNTNVISSSVTGTMRPVTQLMSTFNTTLTWAFATGECGSESWAGLTPAQVASNVQEFVGARKKYIISTGGADGMFTCGSDAGFDTFIQTYYSANLVGIDFDIEVGQSASVIANLVARVQAAEAKYPNLRFSFTVATLGGNAEPTLSSTGANVLAAIQAAGLKRYYVNLMAMDYGSADPSVCTVVNGVCEMGQSAIAASESLHNHYGVPYNQIELTPMIGGNDVRGETFTIADVSTMTWYVLQKQLGGVHFWSFDRDSDCAPGAASSTCNTYGQAGTLGFTNAFMAGLGR
jgi:chitinase